MAEDFAGTPFAGCGAAVEVRDLRGEGLELRWGFGDYGFRVTGAKEAGVGILGGGSHGGSPSFHAILFQSICSDQ
jgi:hypothetical protein